MVSNLLLLWLLHGDVQQLHGFPWVLTPSLVIAGLSSTILGPWFSLASLAREILVTGLAPYLDSL